MMPMSDSTPFAMQAGHFFLNTTFFVVEIFAGRFAAISNILIVRKKPRIMDIRATRHELLEDRPVSVPQIEAADF